MKIRKPVVLALSAALTLTAGVAHASPNHATPDTAALAGELANQTIEWGDCDFGEPGLNQYLGEVTQCATVTVPQDWHNPNNGKTFQIAISRSGNTDTTSDNYVGTLFTNPGGPGEPGLTLSGSISLQVPELAATHTIIGMDPRGSGQSTTVPCTFSYDTADPYGWQRAMAETCGSNPNVKVINTEQTAYDMDFIRHLLGVEKLSYLGYSYGTWLGAWYGSVFGSNTKAMILDSSYNLTAATSQATASPLQPKALERQFHEHLMNWIARHNNDYELGENPAEIYRAYLKGQAAMPPELLRLLHALTFAQDGLYRNEYYPNTATFVALVVRYGQAVAQGAIPESSENPATAALALLKTAKPSPAITRGIARAEALVAVSPVSGKQTETEQSSYSFVECQDGQWDQNLKQVEQRVARYEQQFPFAHAVGLTKVEPCNFWKTDLHMPRPKSDFPKTIILQSELDSATGWEGGMRSGTHLPNTSLIAVDNESSHGLFPYGRADIDQPVIDLLNRGVMPQDVTVVQAKPVPGETTVYESWRPLDANAQHVGEDINDAWQPVPGTENTQPAPTNPVADSLATVASERRTYDVVRDIYGAEGVRALRLVS